MESLGLQPIGLPKSDFGRPTPAFELLEAIRGVPTDDLALEIVSWSGVILSSLVAAGTFGVSALPLAALWVGYVSIINLGARVIIGYGWEWASAEVMFLVIFICPIVDFSSSFPKALPASNISLWLIRFFVFRPDDRRGHVKDRTQLFIVLDGVQVHPTHYETQPMPSALAWFFHHLPPIVHELEGRFTFVEQLIMPIFALCPIRSVSIAVCLIEIFFQLALILTGNYAYLNYLAGIACFALLDDAALAWVMPASLVVKAKETAEAQVEVVKRLSTKARRSLRKLVHVALFFFILGKSAAPIKELFTPAPWLHFYDDYFFVNAHGLFGFINTHRVVLDLSFSHNGTAPFLDREKDVASDCLDSTGVIGKDQSGRSFYCHEVGSYCAQNPQLLEVCPKTCGKCGGVVHVEDLSSKVDNFRVANNAHSQFAVG